jgi:hypothetical protein
MSGVVFPHDGAARRVRDESAATLKDVTVTVDDPGRYTSRDEVVVTLHRVALGAGDGVRAEVAVLEHLHVEKGHVVS